MADTVEEMYETEVSRKVVRTSYKIQEVSTNFGRFQRESGEFSRNMRISIQNVGQGVNLWILYTHTLAMKEMQTHIDHMIIHIMMESYLKHWDQAQEFF